MPSIESAINVEKKEEQPMRIARTVLVAPIPVSDILSQVRRGIPISDISFSEVALIRKSSHSKHSPGLVMAVGGEVDQNETLIEGALREVGEEVTSTSLAEDATKERWESDHKKSFKFKIPGLEEERSIDLYVLPVESRSFSVHKPREDSCDYNSEDKLEDVISMPPKKLKELIETGLIEHNGEALEAAGHFTIAEDASIEITEEDKISRAGALQGVIGDVENFEKNLKVATLLQINKLRRFKHEARVADLSECSAEEIALGFVGAQLRMALLDEKRKELKPGPHKLDSLLKALPYLASKLPAEELPNLLLLIPNKEGKNAREMLSNGFIKGAEVIISALSGQNYKLEKETPCFEVEEKLREVWPDFLNLSLSERTMLLKKAEKDTMQGIIGSKGNGFMEQDAQIALSEVEKWHDFVTGELREQKQSLFQEHRPMNELSNSFLFTRMLYSLGLHPNVSIEDQGQDELRVLRFEALKEMAIFAVELEVAKKLREADISLFQGAIDTYFQFPPMKEYVNLGEGRQHPVYHRATRNLVRGSIAHVLVDERPKKTVSSGARKRFQSRNLNDVHTINFALADDNFNGDGNAIEERLATAEVFKSDLIAHIQNEIEVGGSGWKVSIIEDTHKRRVMERVSTFIKMKAEGTIFEGGWKGGGRAGSNEDAIIREKFILQMTNNGNSNILEVCIYPFESSNSTAVSQLGEAGYWGFAEKIIDDYEGNYKAKRILERDVSSPTVSSLYERLYPRRFYRSLSDRMRKEHVRSRKSHQRKVVN